MATTTTNPPQVGVFPVQKCGGALLNGGGDILHRLVAGVHRQNAADLHDQIDQGKSGDRQGKADRCGSECVDTHIGDPLLLVFSFEWRSYD